MGFLGVCFGVVPVGVRGLPLRRSSVCSVRFTWCLIAIVVVVVVVVRLFWESLSSSHRAVHSPTRSGSTRCTRAPRLLVTGGTPGTVQYLVPGRRCTAWLRGYGESYVMHDNRPCRTLFGV